MARQGLDSVISEASSALFSYPVKYFSGEAAKLIEGYYIVYSRQMHIFALASQIACPRPQNYLRLGQDNLKIHF